MNFHDLTAANLLRQSRRAPVDSHAEDRYYAEHGKPILPSAIQLNAPLMAVLVLAIVGVIVM